MIYYKKNKDFLADLERSEDKYMSSRAGIGRSNEIKILMIVKILLKDTSIFTEEDEEFLQTVKTALEMGNISKKTVQAANNELNKINLDDGIKVLGKLKICFPKRILHFAEVPTKKIPDFKEIILSEYFYMKK